jgi:outer membrane receptor for ferrienterochelin and colicins
MSHIIKLTPIMALLLTSPWVIAADPAPNEPANPAQTPAKTPPPTTPQADVQKVTVTSGRGNETEQRRQASAGKIIYGREELDRNGDTTLGEVLKRLPGVTLGGNAGRGGEIRFRGLGNGYTQILLNGEQAPRGFSIESLSPDQVERVEIIRGPVAELSTRAIAGTINIILREGYQQKETQIRLGDGFEHGRHSSNVGMTHPGKAGKLSYSISASVFETHSADEVMSVNRAFKPQPSLVQQEQLNNQNHNWGIHFSPRLSYRFENGDTLVFQPLVVASRIETTGKIVLTQQIDPILPWASALTKERSDSQVMRAFGTWQQRLPESAKINLKYGFGHNHFENQGQRLQFDLANNLLNTIQTGNDVKTNSFNMGGKFTTPLEKWLGKGHLLAIGWDGEWEQRRQTRVSLNNGTKEFADSGIESGVRTRRLAGFVQDEWDISEKWSTNLGLRWESILTRSSAGNNTGNDIGNNTGNNGGNPAINNISRVWSPVLHNVWRLPGNTKDQIRLGLTRSYRTPGLVDLIALPNLSRLNSAINPDRIGNPGLQPELATGVDLAFEHYLSRSGIVSINLFRRNLNGLIRRTTSLQNGRWVSAPVNLGKANTSGLELEAKFQLAELMENAPSLDFRLNYSRFWSRVEAVPGPDNRLSNQAGQTGNLGLDYRLPQSRLTVGGSYNWTPAYATQTSASERSNTGSKRQLDLYGLWKFSAATQLRISASNLLHRDSESANSAVSANGVQTDTSSARTYATFGIRLEFKI